MGAQFGHGALERAEVVDHGLVDEDVAVGQKQDAFFSPALPQPPNDLKGGVGLASARGHDQQRAVLPIGNGFYRAVDGVELVVARGFAGGVVEGGNTLHFCAPAFPGTVPSPELGGTGELVQRESLLQHASGQRGVAEHKAIAVAGEHKRHVQQLGITQRLLHASAHGVIGVFGLYHRQRDVRLVKQRVVGPQHGAGVAVGFVAADHHPTCTQGKFTKDLIQPMPTRALHGGANVLVANVALGEFAFIHWHPCCHHRVCQTKASHHPRAVGLRLLRLQRLKRRIHRQENAAGQALPQR